MVHLDDLKAFVHNDRNTIKEMVLPILTTLISGLIIILSISPQYLRELNPLTLLLLSVASALPVWAINQLLWMHLEKRMTSQIVGRIVMVFDISAKEKKVLSFALSRLLKAIDIMRFLPSKDIANLVTIVTISWCRDGLYHPHIYCRTLYRHLFTQFAGLAGLHVCSALLLSIN